MSKIDDIIREYIEINHMANTGCDDLAEEVANVTGLHLINDWRKIKNRIRYSLNKMALQGELKKQRVGTGYCGGIDFRFNHFNMYVKQ